MTPNDLLRAYEAALATQDWERVEPLLHDDVRVTFSNGAHFRGKSQVGAAFSKNFALIQDEQYEIYDVDWVEHESCHAVCTYRFRWSGVIEGAPASGGGRGTSVIKNENGTWLVRAEHLGPAATAG